MRHNFVSSSQVICGLWVIPGRRAPLISGFSQRIQSHTQWRYNTNKIINLCWSRIDIVSEGAEMPVRGVDPKADSRDRQVCEKTKLYLIWGLWCWIFSWSKSLWHGFNWKQRERTVNTERRMVDRRWVMAKVEDQWRKYIFKLSYNTFRKTSI